MGTDVNDVLGCTMSESSWTDGSPAIEFLDESVEEGKISNIFESGRSFSSYLLVELLLDLTDGFRVEDGGEDDDLDR